MIFCCQEAIGFLHRAAILVCMFYSSCNLDVLCVIRSICIIMYGVQVLSILAQKWLLLNAILLGYRWHVMVRNAALVILS